MCGILERNKISGPTAPESCGEAKKRSRFGRFERRIYQSCSQDDDLDGGNSNIFWNFHPQKIGGRFEPNLTVAYFSKGGWFNHQPGAAAQAEGGAAKQVGLGVRENYRRGKEEVITSVSVLRFRFCIIEYIIITYYLIYMENYEILYL